MILPAVDYYAIIDISGEAKRPLAVIAETYDRAEAELIAYKRDVVNCSVYWETEQAGKRYIVICPKTNVNSDAKDAL